MKQWCIKGAHPVLVFDVGGSSLRAGLYDPADDRLIGSARRTTPGFREFPSASVAELADLLAGAMAGLADELGSGQPVSEIVVGFPGPVNPQGAVLAAPTVWGDRPLNPPFDFAGYLDRLWPRSSITLLNDVSAAGLYYMRHPAEDFCIFTISSGIGHKIFIGGRPFVGPGGRGGEIGHLTLDFSRDAPTCECGGKGHLGALASGAAAPHAMRAAAMESPQLFRQSVLWEESTGDVDRIGTRDLAQAFRLGDGWARYVAEKLAEPGGRALAAIHLVTGVERFVIVGGFAQALGPAFCHLLARAAQGAGWELGGDWSRMLELGEPHDDAGLIGAGRYVSLRGKAR